MWCLWNGEYGEHDIASLYANGIGFEKNIARMEFEYAKYPGTVVGDFTCVKVEYDWGRRDQRWTVRCNLCGKEVYRYHARDWRSGRGRKVTCDCRKEQRKEQKEHKKKESQKLRDEEQKERRVERSIDLLWENSRNGWTVIDYDGGDSCFVACDECNYEKRVKVSNFLQGKVLPCTHKKPTDYSGDEWIGKRNGHLTAIGRDGSLFVCKCDCGNEVNVRPVELFTRKTKRTCGEPNCEYSSVVHREAQRHKKEGIAYEKEVEQLLIRKGYNAKVTKGVGDYGVDIIITNNDGTMTAVQCKKQISPAGVSAVQEAYAGGRFYDCTRFAVVCDAGFSDQAYYMAKKLGVYLCDGDFDYPEDLEKYSNELLPTFKGNEKNKKYFDINGEKKTLGDWCAVYNIGKKVVQKRLKNGMSLELALTTPVKEEKTYTVGGFTGTLGAICKHFNMHQETVQYRIKYRHMTLEEALFTPTPRNM